MISFKVMKKIKKGEEILCSKVPRTDPSLTCR